MPEGMDDDDMGDSAGFNMFNDPEIMQMFMVCVVFLLFCAFL
jgi:hypothetical protein